MLDLTRRLHHYLDPIITVNSHVGLWLSINADIILKFVCLGRKDICDLSER